jgi:hypothetical protein
MSASREREKGLKKSHAKPFFLVKVNIPSMTRW